MKLCNVSVLNHNMSPPIPGSVCTCSTFSSISETATAFFLSGFNFQYISRAAFLTPLSKRVSVHNFFTSSKFSRVMPEKQ